MKKYLLGAMLFTRSFVIVADNDDKKESLNSDVVVDVCDDVHDYEITVNYEIQHHTTPRFMHPSFFGSNENKRKPLSERAEHYKKVYKHFFKKKLILNIAKNNEKVSYQQCKERLSKIMNYLHGLVGLSESVSQELICTFFDEIEKMGLFEHLRDNKKSLNAEELDLFAVIVSEYSVFITEWLERQVTKYVDKYLGKTHKIVYKQCKGHKVHWGNQERHWPTEGRSSIGFDGTDPVWKMYCALSKSKEERLKSLDANDEERCLDRAFDNYLYKFDKEMKKVFAPYLRAKYKKLGFFKRMKWWWTRHGDVSYSLFPQ